MSLEDLNEKIYQRDYESTRELKTEYVPGKGLLQEDLSFGTQEWEENDRRSGRTKFDFRDFFLRKWKWMVIGLSIIVFLGIIANLAVLRAFLFTTDKVTVSISGPREVASAETVKYVIQYRNDNLLGAKNAELRISFPASFRVQDEDQTSGVVKTVSIGDISGRSTGKVEVIGKFYGSSGEIVYPKVKLRYTPSGMESLFEIETQIGVNIVSSPLVVEITAPQQVASGNDVEYVINYRNEGDVSFSNLRLKVEYPGGFRFNDADPRPSEGDTLWRIGNILPRGSGSVRIRGMLIGIRDEVKPIRASLGMEQGDGTFLSYDQHEAVTRVVTSPLSIRQTVNGSTELSVSPGDKLNYNLRFSNDGDVGIRDAIVTLEINSPYLDFSQLSLGKGGLYDAANHVITWRASDVPALARLEPGQGGEITFGIAVRSDIATDGTLGKNLTIRSVAKIDSPSSPIPAKIANSNSIEIRIGSVVAFDARGYYYDAGLPNTGPVPPRVGSETTYTIRFRVTNYLNDLANVRVRATLATGVRYTGKRVPDTESITSNDRTGELVWDAGNVWGGGKNIREVAFQVIFTPGFNQVGESPRLIQSIVFEGEDQFVKKSIRIQQKEITTALNSDTSLPQEAYKVVAE